jgi:hypothetical protein
MATNKDVANMIITFLEQKAKKGDTKTRGRG